MSARSLNKVQLIGNLTRDPELRYTPQGTAVCSFGMATNRSWTTDTGDRREETEFHRIIAWAKLAELCSQLLFKGRRVYVEGRLQTRQWTAQDGTPRSTTEVVIDDMIILDSKYESGGGTPDSGGGYRSNSGNAPQYDYTQGPDDNYQSSPSRANDQNKPTHQNTNQVTPAPANDQKPVSAASDDSLPEVAETDKKQETATDDDIPF